MQPGFEDRVIVEALSERAGPPSDVLCLPLVATWLERIWRRLGDVLTPAVVAEFVNEPPEYVVSNDLSWLNERIYRATGRTVEIKSLTADRLRREFRALRAGHATRTDDVSGFYKNGLRILRADEIDAVARELFLGGSFPLATEDLFEKAIADLDARSRMGGREGRLYFCANERSLITRIGGSGHYLIYGSEYLYCIGIRVIGTYATKRALKAIGRPTMFVCDLPLKMMRDATLLEFAGGILEYMFCALVEGMEAHMLSPGSGSALSLTSDLPATSIVGHYHPIRVHDPL
ncbi:hypothetical protein FHS31_002970 [Sphingomonas vulcanisoli]|uniref:Uncharacterized protein n=1 Tax=Sphingomonas vulcanisoli TaxID=1658060 RepID=A0ABX0TUX4_9SPHN|nr:hypothetical protein [Sphingomonas vulcanisoli]NIJ09338.1 hypothetical protein [Sphingomonas vulcanisoli]